MNNPHLPFNCTSVELEKEAIKRLRTLVSLLPSQCRIFREPWDCSTVICLDFAQCPHLLNVIQEQEPLLINAIQELGLANSIIFRIGQKSIGWKAIPRLE
ncbi:hypothetical protein [Aphanothece sacrum]|nr:hypothetical protein [Aphanothece sacrum]